MNTQRNETIELNLLLEGIYQKYGYDFRCYSKASLRRRIIGFISDMQYSSISDLQHRILYQQEIFKQLLNRLSINVTSMFRDPPFYKALKNLVLPKLKAQPFTKIWHAGCSTGEEAYSLAILLKEEELYEKCQIYATDIDDHVLQKAKSGIYPAKLMQQYTANYNKSGGSRSFSEYYNARYEFAQLDPSLKKNILFSNHNLAIDSIFGRFDLIICRNVLIYFERELQDRVIKLFVDSLNEQNGYLCLGGKETIRVSRYSDAFHDIDPRVKIYQLESR